MLTFSQRYSEEIGGMRINNRVIIRRYHAEQREERRIDRDSKNIILPRQLRTRLQSEITFLISQGYVENFLTVYDENAKQFQLNKNELRDLTTREIGSDLSSIIDTTTLSFDIGTYDDVSFLDLIEIIIVFSKKDLQAEVIERVNKILQETNSQFIIYGGFIFYKGGSGLNAIVHLLKDGFLKKKIESSYNRSDCQADAKASADMIQYIFSSEEKKSKTKEYASGIVKEIANRITNESKILEFEENFNELVKIAKKFSNTIQDIRHSDKHTIPVNEPNIYKLISNINLNIVEIAILSTPEKYIFNSDINEIKENYIKQYKIDRNKEEVVVYEEDLVCPF